LAVCFTLTSVGGRQLLCDQACFYFDSAEKTNRQSEVSRIAFNLSRAARVIKSERPQMTGMVGRPLRINIVEIISIFVLVGKNESSFTILI
jgi:hypothetical protein